jgi:alkanesulfonate monooxygenase SsuD/methylene tetrahydromethanopterin reductase-like flavin-dependent oxidoreductase (luciferase family)
MAENDFNSDVDLTGLPNGKRYEYLKEYKEILTKLLGADNDLAKLEWNDSAVAKSRVRSVFRECMEDLKYLSDKL